MGPLVDALVIALPKRIASKAVAILKALQPKSPTGQPSFQHLRRFADTAHLPDHLRRGYEISNGSPSVVDELIHFLILPPLPPDHAAIVGAFQVHTEPSFPFVLRPLQVPLYPPVSQEQAERNSTYYWPCSYNPAAQTIQNAPHYQTLRLVTEQLLNGRWQVGHYMRLAQLVGEQTLELRVGRCSGAVAVDSGTGTVVAIAGDARWLDGATAEEADEGRPEHHALMRVIAMVAAKERKGRGIHDVQAGSGMDNATAPITVIERQYLERSCHSTLRDYPPASDVLSDGGDVEELGYLCTGLDIYLTHEPCVMCSMAMVHSRFRACIFGRRMNGTGGLCAETADQGIGYGLCWRKELNWRVITSEYRSQDAGKDDHRLFHA